ncbi:hypothetical protein GOP47_0024954 [Adiantum capillus-veneris]|uniref:Uncharacterized protein n=1 Tax=Adiantum capillus-veneris TaxID=13818 RepID=A0A9D4Z441_ADICA|nr:hypothetical protein GOP47_0024954 [Adiantum capillus-veneris]
MPSRSRRKEKSTACPCKSLYSDSRQPYSCKSLYNDNTTILLMYEIVENFGMYAVVEKCLWKCSLCSSIDTAPNIGDYRDSLWLEKASRVCIQISKGVSRTLKFCSRSLLWLGISDLAQLSGGIFFDKSIIALLDVSFNRVLLLIDCGGKPHKALQSPVYVCLRKVDHLLRPGNILMMQATGEAEVEECKPIAADIQALLMDTCYELKKQGLSFRPFLELLGL